MKDTASKQKEYLAILKKVELISEHKERRSKLKSLIGRNSIQSQSLEREMREARNTAAPYEAQIARPKGSEQVRDGDKRRLSGLNDEISRINRELDKLSDESERAQSEILDIDASLADLEEDVLADEVKAHQNAVLDLAEKAEHLKELIEDHESSIAGAMEGLIDISPLYQEKEDLLAEIAQGSASRDALKPVEEKIAEAEQELAEQKAEKEKAASESRQIISGLQRKLKGVEEELTRLNGMTPKIMDLFYMKEAKSVAEEYQVLALKTIAALARLTALEKIIVSQGERESPVFLTGNQAQAFLPDSLINPVEGADNHGVLFKGIYPNSDLVSSAIRAERERFESMGLLTP